MVGAALNERGIAVSDGSEFYPTLGFRGDQSLVPHLGSNQTIYSLTILLFRSIGVPRLALFETG
jgi:hypothetical protein